MRAAARLSPRVRITAVLVLSSGTALGTGIAVENTTSFGGGITNSGAISALPFAITVSLVSTFTGGISNGGTIAGGIGIWLFSLSIFVGGPGSGGAIVNSGKITGAFSGIRVGFVESFAGGIVNSKGGTITGKSGNGIFVGGTRTPGVASVSSFSGGITNGGTISAVRSFTNAGVGVFVENASIFAGSIVNSSGGRVAPGSSGIEVKMVSTFTRGSTNSGTISAKGQQGILVSDVNVFGSGGAGGGITNSGTISAHQSGILLQNFATFAAGISNSGRIAGRSGIALKTITVFGNPDAEGGITNSGVISAARTGVNISHVTTFLGGIVNLGTITAMPATGDMGIHLTHVDVFGDSSAGGGITNAGTISAASQAILLQFVTTFAGGIVNSGRLVAKTGIHNGLFTLFDAGAAGSGIA